jgi:glycosyltransferase involved in cell wall biosynthesis
VAEISIGTFYHGAGEVLNVSGFRFACETLLEGFLCAPEVARLRVFAIGLSEEGRARFAARFLDRPEARARCELVPLCRVADAPFLRMANLDVLHEMEQHLRRAMAARAYRGPGALPISVSTHGNRIGARAVSAFYLPLLLGDLRPGDSIVCASQASRTALLRHLAHLQDGLQAALGVTVPFRGTIAVIPFGVPAERFRPRPRDAARAALALPAAARILLWHGRVDLNNKQDPAPLLLVLRRLLRDHPDVRLLLSAPAGAGAALVQARAAQLGIAGHLIVREGVAREQVPLLYAASDVALCLSDTIIENFGLTALEAMACGVPVVAADWAGCRDTVVHGDTGLLVPTLAPAWEEELDLLDALDVAASAPLAGQAVATDCDGLEAALRTLLGDPALAARLGEAGRRRVLTEYTVEIMASRHVALWREMAARARADAGAARPHGVRPPRMEEIFAHYPAYLLRDEATVELTADGRALARGEDTAFIAPLPGQPIEEGPLRALVSALLSVPAQTVGAVVSRACRRAGCTPPQARRHLAWLIKQGYVRIGSPLHLACG